MDDFKYQIMLANLHTNPDNLSLEQVLSYITDIAGSNLPLQEKATLMQQLQIILSNMRVRISEVATVHKILNTIESYNRQ